MGQIPTIRRRSAKSSCVFVDAKPTPSQRLGCATVLCARRDLSVGMVGRCGLQRSDIAFVSTILPSGERPATAGRCPRHVNELRCDELPASGERNTTWLQSAGCRDLILKSLVNEIVVDWTGELSSSTVIGMIERSLVRYF